MPRFAIVEPKNKSIRLFDADDYKLALKEANIADGVDFGTVATAANGSTMSIIVFEWSLMDDAEPAYFAIDGQLYNGNAVLFLSDREGETIDFPAELAKHLQNDCTHLLWLGSVEATEAAIAEGKVTRPQMSINGQVHCQWNRQKD